MDGAFPDATSQAAVRAMLGAAIDLFDTPAFVFEVVQSRGGTLELDGRGVLGGLAARFTVPGALDAG